MFAPKMATAQTSAPDGPTRKLAPQPSTIVARPSGGAAVEHAQMRRGVIEYQATLDYLTQRLSDLTAKGPAKRDEREAASENMTAREASRGPSWDFGRIPVFPSDRASRPQPSSPLAATPLHHEVLRSLPGGSR